MFCGKCGHEIPDGTKFCGFCGNVIGSNDNFQQSYNSNIVKMIFTRKKKMLGMVMPMKVLIDGNTVAVLENGESQEVDVLMGIHKILIDTGGDITEEIIDCTPEYSRIYVVVAMKFGVLTGRAVIESIRREK